MIIKHGYNVLTDQDLARILMVCGCINDIAEKSKEKTTGEQLKRVQKILEKIVTTNVD